MRCFARCARRDNESPCATDHGTGAFAIAVIGGNQRNGVVATIIRARRKVEYARAIAVISKRGKAWQACGRERERITVGIHHRHRQIEHAAAIHKLIGDLRHDRRAIRIAHHDRNGGGGAERR